MRVLVFDTETTGLPKIKFINKNVLHMWSHIVQLSYIIYDTDNNDILHSYDQIVKVKDNILIPENSVKFHGITNEISFEKGIYIEEILNDFFEKLLTADILVGHNISFDINMVMVELLRIINENKSISKKEIIKYNKYLKNIIDFKNICCTMKDSVEICNISATNKSGETYLKFPKLIELHKILFETSPNHLHNSFNDILVTLRCYIKIKFEKDLNISCEKFKKLIIENNIL